jgi:hypothetical protein
MESEWVSIPSANTNSNSDNNSIDTSIDTSGIVDHLIDDNNRLWYINNYIDWDSYNTLFNLDWKEENKREIKKVKRRLSRQ